MIHQTRSVNYFKLGIIILVIIGVLFTISLVGKQIKQNTKAAIGNSTMMVQPATATINSGANGTMNIFIVPNGDKVNSVEVVLNYDAAVLQITDVKPGSFFTDHTGTVGAPVEVFKQFSNGKIHYAIGFPLGSKDANGNPFSSSTAGAVAVISYLGKSNGSSPVAFVTTGSPQTIVSDINSQNVLNAATGATVTVGSQTQSASLKATNIQPVNPQVIGRTFTADVVMDTGGVDVAGAEAKMTFNPSVLQVVKVEKGTIAAFTSYPALVFNNTAGTITIAGNTGGGTAKSVNGTALLLGKVTFNVAPNNTAATTTVDFNFTKGNLNDSNIAKYDLAGGDPQDVLDSVVPVSITISNNPPLTPTVQLTATPVPPTPTKTPVQQVTIRYKLQGKTRAGVSKAANLTLNYRPVNTSVAFTTVSLTGSANGEANLTIAPGSYVMTISSAGYLTRMLGTDTSPVTIVANNNLLDISNIALLGGDFNADEAVNEIDYTMHFLTNYGKATQLVDLDGSTEVNNLDFVIMRNNWVLP